MGFKLRRYPAHEFDFSLRWWRSEYFRNVALVAPALAFMSLMLILPLGLILHQSVMPQVGATDQSRLVNYFLLFSADGEHYRRLLGRSLAISLVSTASVLFLAYPAAYFLAFGSTRRKALWLVILIVPFWISYLLRIFSWKLVLGFNGVINSGLKYIGFIEEPVTALFYNSTAVSLALAHSWSAFAVLPIYVSLQKIDPTLFEASLDLGDSPLKRFSRVTLPLSMPGVIGAFVLVFVPVMGDYITPQLVGGTSSVMIGSAIGSLFGKENNAPLGAALSVLMMIAIASTVLVIVVILRLWITCAKRIGKSA